MPIEELVAELLKQCHKEELTTVYVGPEYEEMSRELSQEINGLKVATGARQVVAPLTAAPEENIDVLLIEPAKIPEIHGRFILDEVYFKIADSVPRRMAHLTLGVQDKTYDFEVPQPTDHPMFAGLYEVLHIAEYKAKVWPKWPPPGFMERA